MDFTKAFIFFCLKLGEIYLALNHIVPACIKRLHPQLLSHKILTFSGGEGGGGGAMALFIQFLFKGNLPNDTDITNKAQFYFLVITLHQ